MSSGSDGEIPGGIPIFGTDRAADPCILVIFGASGDLTKRLLMPALFNLACDRLLPGRFAIVGIAMDEMTTEQFREKMTADIKKFGDPQELRRRRLERVRRAAALHARQVQRPRRLRALARRSSKLDAEHHAARQHHLLHGHPAQHLRDDLRAHRRRRVQEAREGLDQDHRREAVRPRPPLGHRAEQAAPLPVEGGARSTGSTTTWARRPSRTSWRSGSPTGCSSRSGTRATSTTSSSAWPRPWASRGGASITTLGRAPRHDPEPHVPDARLPLHGAAPPRSSPTPSATRSPSSWTPSAS